MGQYAPLLILGTQLLGSGMQAAGTQQQTDAVRAESRAAQQAALYNAELAALEARRSTEAGYEEEERIRRGSRRYLAQRRAAIGKSGFGIEGTPLRALVADAKELELEAIYARREGLEGAQSALMTRQLELSRASTIKQQGRYAARGTLISGIGGTLASAAQAGATYYQLTRPR